MAAVLDPLYGKGTREIRAAERRGHSRPSNGREPWSEHRTWRPLRCWPSRRWAHRCRAGPPHRLRSHAGRLLRETLRDALRVLAPIRYNPASSYPSFDRAKCNSIAELACRGLQWGVSVRRLLISGSEVRVLHGPPSKSGASGATEVPDLIFVTTLLPRSSSSLFTAALFPIGSRLP